MCHFAQTAAPRAQIELRARFPRLPEPRDGAPMFEKLIGKFMGRAPAAAQPRPRDHDDGPDFPW